MRPSHTPATLSPAANGHDCISFNTVHLYSIFEKKDKSWESVAADKACEHHPDALRRSRWAQP